MASGRYQRLHGDVAIDFRSSSPTPFKVSGNGGYHNLHQIHSENGTVAADPKAIPKYGKVCWGYLTLKIDKKTIGGKLLKSTATAM